MRVEGMSSGNVHLHLPVSMGGCLRESDLWEFRYGLYFSSGKYFSNIFLRRFTCSSDLMFSI